MMRIAIRWKQLSARRAPGVRGLTAQGVDEPLIHRAATADAPYDDADLEPGEVIPIPLGVDRVASFGSRYALSAETLRPLQEPRTPLLDAFAVAPSTAARVPGS